MVSLLALLLAASPIVDPSTGLRFRTDVEGFQPCVLAPEGQWDDACGERPVLPEQPVDLRARMLFLAFYRTEQQNIVLLAATTKVRAPQQMTATDVDAFVRGTLQGIKREQGQDFELVLRDDGSKFERVVIAGAPMARWVVENAAHDRRIIQFGIPMRDAMVVLAFHGGAAPALRGEIEKLASAIVGALRPPPIDSQDFAMPRDQAYELGRRVGALTCDLLGFGAVLALIVWILRAARRKPAAPPGPAP